MQPAPADVVGTIVIPLVSAAIGALLGAIGGFWGARHQSKADLARQRKAVASAVLAELEYMDPSLRAIFRMPNAASMQLTFTVAALDRFGEHVGLFAGNTIREVFACEQKLRELRAEMEMRHGKLTTPQDHWQIRMRTGFAIRAINRARAALQREGGECQALPPGKVHEFPTLPELDDLLKLPPGT
jgi:hypothetical protein